MTSRERFASVMSLGRPDRLPLLDEGIRDDVLERWREEGLGDTDPRSLFAYDRRERLEVDLGARPGLGRPVESAANLAELRSRLDPSDPARLPADWPDRARGLAGREHLLEMWVHSGFFLTHGADRWDTVEALLVRCHDEPALVRGVLEAYAECAVRVIERVLSDAHIDFAGFSEPISGPDRPLLGPRMYRALVLPTYRLIIEALHRGGCRTVVYQTYANSRALLPSVVDCGFDCLWAVETQPEAMDYVGIRGEFGDRLRLIGGIDLDTIRQGPDALKRDFDERIGPLAAGGGFIPLADGRVRIDVPFEHYRAYRGMLEDLATRRT